MTDLTLTLDKALADKLLGAIEFPIRKVFPSARLAASDTSLDASEVESQISLASGQDSSLALTDAIGEFVEDLVIAELLDPSTDYRDANPSNADTKFIKWLEGSIGAFSAADDKALRAKIKSAMQQKSTANDLVSVLGDIRVGIVWVKLVMLTRPGGKVANPIELSKVRVTVQAKAEACVNLFGKWHCATATSPPILLEARKIKFELLSAPPVLKGRPSFSDLDIVIAFKIFGKKFKIKIGITSFVNRHLAKQEVVVADFSQYEAAIPESTKHLRVQSLVPQNVSAGLAIGATFSIV